VSKEYIFETEDCLGRVVRYRKEVFDRHLPEHPEMAAYTEEIRITVSDPDYGYEDEDNETTLSIVYYRLGLGRGKYQDCFIKVPVYYDKSVSPREGEIATAHFSRRVGGGKLIWRRS